MKNFIFNFLLIMISGHLAQGAACCGGSLGAPSLISGDEQAQLSTSYSYNRVEAKALGNGQWQKLPQAENTETLKIEAAKIVSDLWQLGGTLPLVRKSKSSLSGQDSSGLGDVSVDVAYEFLPDWDYSPWRPHGVGFLQLTLPTGKSVNESTDPNNLDSRGRGFWALGAGANFNKVAGPYDFQALVELHRSLDKKTSDTATQTELSLKPGWGSSALVGAAWSSKRYRLGSTLSWNYEEATRVESSAVNSQGQLERFMTAGFSVSYLVDDEWSSSLSYSDQTLFGSPNNTSLGRIAQVALLRRWSR